MMRHYLSIAFTVFWGATTAAFAQDRPNTILVMDGSGSMWGQIDGIAKITIAQDVVSELLDSLPGEERLGLTVYGHRERGSCTDIETVVPPAEGTRDAIAAAVNGIKPLGKTPMTDAVIAAAEALRYTEDSATVILVSDGVETCNPDPCAAARLLEEAAIDFTAHVIGFDVGGDPEAIEQMQCIAEETGGMFIPAANAGELSAALTTVVEEPEPVTVEMTFTAVIGDDQRILESPVLWDINSDDGLVLEDVQQNPMVAGIAEGAYVATAYSLELEETVNVNFVAVDGGATGVIAEFEEPALTARIIAPATVAGGTTFGVGWDGPNDQLDTLRIYPEGEDTRGYDTIYVNRGNPLDVIAPFHPGTYEIRYLHKDREVIGSTLFEVTEAPVSLDAPIEVPVSSEFDVAWVGPDAKFDIVQIGDVGETNFISFKYTNRGNPAQLTAPSEPGTYELRYKFRDREVIYTQPIEVTAVLATLSAPAEAIEGATVTVEWTGPGYERDYIGIGKVGSDGADAWENFTYSRDGSPLELLVPLGAGDYEIKYFLGNDRKVLASTSISVTPVTASLTAPSEAIAGSTINVEWEGPDYERDYVGIGLVDAEASDRWENFFYTDAGNPGKLLIPTAPGDYEISYFAGQDRSILTSIPISVADVTAALTVPETVVAGSTIDVEWSGPGYERDYVGIGLAGADGSDQWENFFYTNDGNPGELLVPTTPGDYVVSYFSGQDRSILTSVSLAVTDVTAQLTVPVEAVAGSTISVDWTGPGYERDYVGIGVAGADGSDQWENFFYTDVGSPGQLLIPTTPGDYVVSYFSGQDRSVLTSVSLIVTDVTAQLTVPTEAIAGSTISVDWTGPGYERDYVGIGVAGADGSDRWQNFFYTDVGSPGDLLVPTTSGDYIISYFSGQDRSILTSASITVTDVTATIEAADSVVAGSTIAVDWNGPNYDRDYVGIGLVGSDGSDRWENFAYTTDGSPSSILVPTTPGDYLITYFLGQDRSILKARPITVTAIKSIQLLAEDTAAAGSELIVGWDGPDYDRDYIGIGLAGSDGSDQWQAFAYTRDGNPLSIRLPDSPGDYVITYFLGQDRSAAATRPLTIE